MLSYWLQSSSIASEDAVRASVTFLKKKKREISLSICSVDFSSLIRAVYVCFRLLNAPPLSTCWGPESEAAPGFMNGDAR